MCTHLKNQNYFVFVFQISSGKVKPQFDFKSNTSTKFENTTPFACVKKQMSHESSRRYSDAAEQLSGAFAQLNLSQDMIKKVAVCDFGSTSLPYTNSSSEKVLSPYSFSTPKENVDYNRKGSQKKVQDYTSLPVVASSQEKKNFSYTSNSPSFVEEDVSYGIYTETDLDQPTDYSLR